MNNWKEEFEKKFRNNDLAFPYLKNSYSAFRGKTLFKEIITFIAQVEQDAYKRGCEDTAELTAKQMKNNLQNAIKEIDLGLEEFHKELNKL